MVSAELVDLFLELRAIAELLSRQAVSVNLGPPAGVVFTRVLVRRSKLKLANTYVAIVFGTLLKLGKKPSQKLSVKIIRNIDFLSFILPLLPIDA